MEPVRWFKSTRSGNNGACVEVALLTDDEVGIRDTKARGQGPILTFTRAEWNVFVGGAKDGQFDPA
jgi:hypothetical protein